MTYQEMCEGLAVANGWLASLGVREPEIRIRQHIERIGHLEEARRAGRLNEIARGIECRQTIFSLTESIEFLDIHAAFGSDDVPGLRHRLREALQGPADLGDESPASNQARNIMFELNLAARLRSRGLPVTLPENPDVLTAFRDVPIYIQCKRPFREATIPANIDNARVQLVRDLGAANEPLAKGLIAISVSRVFNPGNRLFRGPTEIAVRRCLGDEVQRMGESSRNAWGGIQDARIIGILYHIISPTVLEDIGLLTVAQEMVVFPLPGRPALDSELLRDITNALAER